MTTLPVGTQTFLMTDIAGSTALFERDEPAMFGALARHNALMTGCAERHDGAVIKHRLEGDSFFAVFARATDAVAAAADMQRALATEPWPGEIPVRVRMAIHSGEAQLRGDDYFGLVVNRCARLREIAHGGQVLLSNAAHALVGGRLPPGVEVRHLGRHRLRDLQEVEEIHQLVVAGLPADFPALPSMDAFPNNLPNLLSSFVGRSLELETTGHLLHSSRLLTLTGVGGTGKTRLALQLAAHNIDRFPDGAWVVDLATVADPADVPRAVAAAVGVHEVTGIALTDTLCDHVGASEQLIILDNCEHLLDACVALIEPLLARCPALHIVATSREPFKLAGEQVYLVPEMSLPPAGEDAPTRAALGGSDAVELFVERARASEHRFELTDANARAVAELCRLLDGIPLSIELAAPMVRVLDLGDVVRRLQRFGLRDLQSRDPTVEARHASVERMIQWSYELCSPKERALFDRLAVFAEVFSLEAAEAVCAGGEVLAGDVFDLLASLIDQSLVVKVATPAGVRYRLLWTIGEFARKRLEAAGDDAAYALRHADHYARLAIETGPRLAGSEQQALQDALGAESANFERALATLRGTGQPERALEMAAALWRLWYLRGQYAQGRREIEQCLIGMAGSEAKPDLALAHYGAGTLASFQGDSAAAVGHLERAIALYRELGDPLGEAKAQNSVGGIHLRDHRYEQARGALKRSLEVFENVGDAAALAVIRYNMALVHEGLAEYAVAESQVRECLEVFQRLGNRSNVARCWSQLGLIALHRGDVEAAITRYAECIPIFESLDDDASVAEALHYQGSAHLAGNDVQGADHLLRLAHERQRRLGMRDHRVIECRCALAEVALAQGHPERASALVAQCRSMVDAVNEPWPRAVVLVAEARLELHRGHLTTARHGFARSLRLGAELGLHVQEIDSLDGLVGVAAADGRHGMAAILAASASRLRELLAIRPPPRRAAMLEAVRTAARAVLDDEALAAAEDPVASWTWSDVVANALSFAEAVDGVPSSEPSS